LERWCFMEKDKKVKKTVSKKSKKKENIFGKLVSYFKGVRSEMKKTKWPSKKEMVLYSSATLLFILIFALFFTFNDIVISFVKQLVR